MILDRTSRPAKSVPIQCSGLGGCNRLAMFISAGSYGASHGARIAIVATAATTIAPNRPVRLATIARRNSRAGPVAMASGARTPASTTPVTSISAAAG